MATSKMQTRINLENSNAANQAMIESNGEVRTDQQRADEKVQMDRLESIGHVTMAYDAAQIQVLEGLEAVRRNVPMYVGGTDSKGLHHLFTEVSDNSVDEALAGYCTLIEVILHANGSVSVRDNGRGIPPELLNRFRAAGEGMGVGLAGIGERVRELGGKLNLESDSSGTSVWITIPIPADGSN